MEKPDFDHYKHSAPEYTEQILWHRIVAVALFGLAVLIMLGWLGYWLLATPPAPPPAINAPKGLAHAENVSSEESPIPTPMLTSDSSKPKPDETEAAQEDPIESNVSVATAETLQPAEEDWDNELGPLVAEEATVKSDSESSTAQTTADQSTANQSNANRVNESEFEVTTRIMDGDVSRAELASSMQELEPEAEVENTGDLTDPFIKLYFFTDLKDRAGDRLTYTWIRNGKTAATVRIPVGSDRWRSHASKNISQSMRGEWEVIVTDKEGDTLAKTHFVLPDVAVLSQ